MLTQLQVPGFGIALMGLDWLTLPGHDNSRDEIKQLGRGTDAAWEFVWSGKGQAESSVAFVSRGMSKRRPVAAAALIRAAITEHMYLTLIDVADDRVWLFATQNGVPIKRADHVGTLGEVMLLLQDLLSEFSDTSTLPIYTDKQDQLEQLPYVLDVRPFSLQILAHSIKKRDFKRAGFKRHTSFPTIPLLICVALLAGICGYYVYQAQVEDTARRDAALVRERAIAQRKLDLGSAVNAAINTTLPARQSVPAYLEATRDLKRLLAGWRLTSLECAGAQCTLTYQAQAFATWSGFLAAKPDGWPAPTFDSDTQKVTQPLAVQLPLSTPRTIETLPSRDAANQKLGNLAQVSKMLGLTLTLPSAWARVAGNAAIASPEESWIPMMGSFNAAGSAVLLEDLAARLPPTSGVSILTLKLDDPLTFDLKGTVYANP
ncbi:putative PilO-like pilus assembly protein [Pseudomonas coronafaciens pv. garcae]|uniref:type 4b pilus protein PilO2 n=1 Tax=Pseudomonas syringae group TaxID=136849 RepID=UPI000F00B1BE|nr:type 4b pilus protein PilO2 [Pseudomonas coronafaciens]RMS09360.1 putative PilO-like pilus assembly protein [Pseudomonas coronafaciens pv. garcae]